MMGTLVQVQLNVNPPTPFCPRPAPKSLYKGEPLLILKYYHNSLTLQVLEDIRKTVSKLGRSLDEVVASTPRCALVQVNHKFGRNLFPEKLEGAKIPCICLFSF